MVKEILGTMLGLVIYLTMCAIAVGVALLFIEIAPYRFEYEATGFGLMIGGIIAYVPMALYNRAHRKGKRRTG